MALVGLATLVVVGLILARLGASPRRLYAGVFAVALSPLVIGPVSLNTYDAFPALLVACALAALLWRRDSLALGLLGVGFAAKLYAAALVPLFAVWLWRSRRDVVRPLSAFAVTALLLVGPFAILGWDGLVESVHAQAGRGLQIESFGAVVLLAADQLGLYSAEVGRGSTAAVTRDLEGGLPDTLAVTTSFLQVVAVAVVVVLFLRARSSEERLTVATAATLAGFLVFARFISPQYLVWLVPIVPLVGGVAGVVATVLLGAALLAGRLWFFDYREVFALEGAVWLVVIRDLLLVALYAVLLRTMIPSLSKTLDQEPERSSSASGTAVAEGSERLSR